MKKAFTLVELLVVIAILGALIAVLIPVIGRPGESARAAKCKANLKSLASAVQAVASEQRYYPLAGSIERYDVDTRRGTGSKAQHKYDEVRGWISWNSKGAYETTVRSHIANQGWFTSAYDTDREARLYSLTNGAIWEAVGRNESVYRCPGHLKKFGEGENGPNWSYVMNERYGADTEARAHGWYTFPHIDFHDGQTYGDFNPERTLLFAELQWEDYTNEKPDKSTGTKSDCTLQYKGGARESIGFNHKNGRRILAHVVFGDGRVEEIEWSDAQDMKQLTEWLCQGKDVMRNASSKRYEKVD